MMIKCSFSSGLHGCPGIRHWILQNEIRATKTGCGGLTVRKWPAQDHVQYDRTFKSSNPTSLPIKDSLLLTIFNPTRTKDQGQSWRLRQMEPKRLFVAAEQVPHPDHPEDVEKCRLARQEATTVDSSCDMNDLLTMTLMWIRPFLLPLMVLPNEECRR